MMVTTSRPPAVAPAGLGLVEADPPGQDVSAGLPATAGGLDGYVVDWQLPARTGPHG
jgi:hypothetical protein